MVGSFELFYERQLENIKTLPLQTQEFFLMRLEPFLEVFGISSMHKVCNWKPKHDAFVSGVDEPAAQKPTDNQEEEEPAEPIEEEPEPRLTGVIAWAGMFFVSESDNPKANGAYLHYQEEKKQKKLVKRES